VAARRTDIDDEFAAELEVGLVDEFGDDLVPTPAVTLPTRTAAPDTAVVPVRDDA